MGDPEFITKFFMLKDLRYYFDGCIRFGTAQIYRNEENQKLMGARHDPRESMFKRSIHMNFRNPSNTNIGNAVKIAAGAKNIFGTLSYTEPQNEWIFSAMSGDYSIEGHRGLLYPDANGYPGDTRLLAYAVFDLKKLGRAVHRAALLHKEYAAKEDFLASAAVIYGDPNNVTLADDRKNNYEPGPGSFEEYIQTFFHKDKFFSPEREHWLLLRLKAPYCAPSGAPPVILQSSEIRASMVRIGPFAN